MNASRSPVLDPFASRRSPASTRSCFTCAGCDFWLCTLEFEDDVKKAADEDLAQWLQNHNVLARGVSHPPRFQHRRALQSVEQLTVEIRRSLPATVIASGRQPGICCGKPSKDLFYPLQSEQRRPLLHSQGRPSSLGRFRHTGLAPPKRLTNFRRPGNTTSWRQ
jgi:hypothetical protein